MSNDRTERYYAAARAVPSFLVLETAEEALKRSCERLTQARRELAHACTEMVELDRAAAEFDLAWSGLAPDERERLQEFHGKVVENR